MLVGSSIKLMAVGIDHVEAFVAVVRGELSPMAER